MKKAFGASLPLVCSGHLHLPAATANLLPLSAVLPVCSVSVMEEDAAGRSSSCTCSPPSDVPAACAHHYCVLSPVGS